MSRIKVLYFHHGGGEGGAPQSLLYLLKNLDLDRYEPIVSCGYDEPHAKEFFEEHGYSPTDIPVARFSHVWPGGWWPVYNPRGLARLFKWLLIHQPRSVKRFKRVLDEVKPDIVHLNSLTIAPLAYIAKRRRIPVVLHVRESVIKGSFGMRLRWLRWLSNKCADWTIYICKDNQDRLTGSTEHSSVIYNPIPFEKFDSDIDGVPIRERLGIPLDATILFFPGGSSGPPKGIYPFLNALAIIRAQYNDVFAIIPGIESTPENKRGSARMRMEKIIKIHQMEDAIFRLPFTGSVQQYFAIADIVVTPFIVPHFSRAAIESGAMRKPVVGSRIGGVEEVISDGETGLLVNPDDTSDLADKLLQLIRDPKKCREMGESAYMIASVAYRAENHAVAVMKVYQTILNRRTC